MAQSTEDVSTEEVGKIVFSFMTTEEVKKHSVVKIINPILLNTLGHPTAAGLYDPLMGTQDITSCKSCGQGQLACPGHCGHIDLVSPIYNPLLFDKLYSLLQQTCFNCYHFRINREEVNKCVSRLKLIAKGDVIGARNLDAVSSNFAELISPEDSEGSNVSHLSECGGSEDQLDDNRQTSWDSFQYTEAMSVLSKFLKLKPVKCSNCSAKNPKITKSTFGWFERGLSNVDIRRNMIASHKIGGTEDSEVTNANDENDLEAIDSSTTKSDKKKSRKASDQLKVERELQKHRKSFSGPLLPTQVKDILKQLWENESPLCSFICDLMSEQQNTSSRVTGHLMFFLESILVPPTRFRPPAKSGDSVMDHPHTVLFGKVLQSNIALGNAHVNDQRDKIVDRWKDLQHSVNILYNNSKPVPGQSKVSADGIQQFIEKKEGIFRQKMMGKRVNFACRSVISPDPYLGVNEIGIPPYFALKLTYPEKVTPWNVGKLRNAIVNGPDVHPGALSYADKVSTAKLPLNKKARIAISRKLSSNRGAGTQLGKNSEYEFEGKVVLRHLQDGDIVLVNRQPTLHKPSIMAHVVRVLKGEKTLRMHYANCSSYNADFDGDEMNVHFPQDEISRAEAYNIVNANEQYIVPTKGDTVRGLIQDHIVSAVLLTMKDTFLTQEEYNQLLYGSLGSAVRPASLSSNHSAKIFQIDSEVVLPVLPALWKPKPLWTGKQVITSLLNHLTRGCAPCTIEKEMKIPKQYFPSETFQIPGDKNGQNKSDNCFFVLKNELVCGVLDKAQFGQFGLVHTVQELYGSNTAGLLLSALSRLFTLFLQIHGFTCGVEDLMILPRFDVQRKAELEGEDVGEEVHCDFVNFKGGQIGPSELQLEVEKVLSRDRESATALLDMKMKNKLTTKASQISKELLLKGLLKPFPKNCISLMTISGAKGSTVNFQQISSYLGQQELEGKRVPRMVSGKTLPCFPPWDFTSRAGGFITDRFLSGLRPQEYYFHCMAGREGLVDTAVKTSRSGYLQRILIKNLESLKVSYDYTVRDADGSIVQFYYGEDGVDVHRTSFLKNLKALQLNEETLRDMYRCEPDSNSYIVELPVGLKERAESFLKAGKTNSQTFLKLLTQKYMSSLAPPGEPVGVIAAQSVGEPSTQMTLNTFHLAGRGEMNVTLGIPRLKEILNSASVNISTPVLTCPFLQLQSKDDANLLVRKVMKITVADIIESMEVQLLPLSVYNNEMGRVYKILMTLKHHELVSQEDCEETLKHNFLRGLEDAIENHMALQSRIAGIKNYKQASSSKEEEKEMDEDASTSHGKETVADEDVDSDDDGNDDDNADKGSDEMDYEDASGDESADDSAGESSDELGAGEKEDIINDGDKHGSEDARDNVGMSKLKSKDKVEKSASKKKKKSKKVFAGKETDRNIFVEVRGKDFEAHFRFTDEPHILLAQIALKTAKSVYIKSSGKINHCKLVEYDVSENTVIWDKEKVDEQAKLKKHKADQAAKLKKHKADQAEDLPPYCALKAAGIDFTAFWEMQDDLDVTRIYSNSIHAMLTTYGVEAARETIIREVKNVFRIYGVEIDFRHLSLIADYMTKSGGYRSMSRTGCIKDTLSPLAKMSFETASKFLQEAASFGIADDLETPSARICLGLPVKVGTGSFDVMQKFEI